MTSLLSNVDYAISTIQVNFSFETLAAIAIGGTLFAMFSLLRTTKAYGRPY